MEQICSAHPAQRVISVRFHQVLHSPALPALILRQTRFFVSLALLGSIRHIDLMWSHVIKVAMPLP
jgi:hypothetical protein